MNLKAILNSALKRLIFGLLTFMALVGLLIVFLNRVDANNPTFFLSANGCGSATNEISGMVGENKTLYACVDGGNEGAGLFGAEINIAYDTSLISVTSVGCRNFDSCSNLSSPGNIRLLGVSGAAPDGNAVTGWETFGNISFTLKQAGTAQLNYVLATVIDENQGVQSRIGIGSRVNIASAPEPEPIPTPTPTPPAPAPETIEPVAAPETAPPPVNQSLSKVVISPLETQELPGGVVQIISRADYEGGRASENVTSCFDCPAIGNKLANGRIKYEITGPATVYDNRVTINSNATPGQVVRIKAIYNDFKSNTTATSNIRGITVIGAPQSEPEGIGPGELRAPEDREQECDPNTGRGCEPTTDLAADLPNPDEPECLEPNGCPDDKICDPNAPDCTPEENDEACDPLNEDCPPAEEDNCDPNHQDCDQDGEGECDPNSENCDLENKPECEGDCEEKVSPDCEGEDCQGGESNYQLVCHVLDTQKNKFIGALVYLPSKEAEQHLNQHEPDYAVSDIDDNLDNDSQDCLGIDLCEYKNLHSSAEENKTDQCNTEEILTLTETSLFHPAADECVTCGQSALVKPTNEFCTMNYPLEVDTDKDGLSDRTECYLNTDANEVDSDNDSCWDGDEINLFHTNPLVQTDCALSEMAYESVVITDPKNDWIVKSLNISGVTPKTTLDVGLTAFPASHKFLNPVFESFDKLVLSLQEVINPDDTVAQEKRKAEISVIVKETKEKILAFHSFVQTQESVNYEKETSILKTVEGYLEKTPDEMLADFSQAEAFKRSLQTIQTGGTFLGVVSQFNEVALGDETVRGFNLVPRVEIEDGLYDLVAVARLKNKTLTSKTVRIVLDSNAQVNSPQPETLDGITLDPTVIKQGWELISENTLSQIEVKTKNGRPVVSGQSSYGAQIFATWESLALSSSIIVDSSEGGFEIQAPRDLDKNEAHKVTLYAVVDTDRGEVRSDNVTVNFQVGGSNYLLWILLGLGLIIVAAIVARHRMKKIDALPPEHRAKENELYHAFGEKELPTPLPENHAAKEEEVNAVFRNN